MNACQVLQRFADAAEIAEIEGWIAPHRQRFQEAAGYVNFGPRCRYLGGEQIERWLPELVAYGEQQVRPVVEAFAGGPLEPAGDRGRARRLQIFTHPGHGFRWHYDIAAYAALLTLQNTCRAQTQVIPPALSRWLQPAYYPLAWTPQIFSLLPYERYALSAGDLLIMRGDKLLHRGVALSDGERVLLVYAFQIPGRRASSLRSRFARYVNTRPAAP